MKTAAFAPLIIAAAAANAPAQEIPKSHRDIQFPPLPPFQPARAEKVELPNGLALYLMEDRELPFIAGFARVRVGSVYEPADKVGLASIAGTVMRTGGSTRFPGDRLDVDLAKIAASVESSIGEESGGASFRCLKEDFPQVFEIFSDLLRRPAFPQGKIDLSKKEISTSIARRNDNPGPIAAREFQKVAWGAGSPWARLVEYEHLARIQREDLLAFHEAYFAPNNVRLGIVGDFDLKAMREAVEAAFRDWPRRPVSFPKIAAEPLRPEKAATFLVDKPEVNQSTIYLGHEGVRRDDPDYPALRLFSFILGQGGFSSRLLQVVRSEKGLAYSVGGGFQGPYGRRGLFQASCGTKCESTASAIEAILGEFRRILEERPSEAELASAKERILNADIFQFDTREKVLRRQVELDFFGYPQDFPEQEIGKIRSLSLEEVWQAGRRHLDPARLAIVVVGNAKSFDSPLERFGPLSALDVTIPRPPEEEAPEATPESISRGRAILSSWIEAAGGVNALQGIRSFQMKGEGTRSGPNDRTWKFPVEMTAVLPDKLRVRNEVFGTEIVTVIEGNGGWTKGPQGVKEIPAAQAQEAKATLDRQYLSLLIRAARGEFQPQFLKNEAVNGTACETVRIRDEKGLSINLSFHAGTHQLVRESYREGNDDLVLLFEDFRQVGEIFIPFQSKKLIGGRFDRSTSATDYALNVEVDNAIFQRPPNGNGRQ